MAWFVQTQYRDRDSGTYCSPDIARVEREHERFNDAAKALASEIERKWMAGDQNSDSADYPEFSSGALPRLVDGWRFPAFDAPLYDQLKHIEGDIVDIVSTSFGSYAVSKKVIDIIESIEPGVHHFIPYGMLNPDRSIHLAKRWLLNLCTRAEAVDIERSNVVWMDFGGGRRKFGDITAGGRVPHVVVNAGEASQRAIWCEWRYHSGRNVIVSDRLWDALQAEAIKGWGTNPSYPDRIEEI